MIKGILYITYIQKIKNNKGIYNRIKIKYEIKYEIHYQIEAI